MVVAKKERRRVPGATEERRLELLGLLYEDGMGAKEIAAHFGIHANNADRLLTAGTDWFVHNGVTYGRVWTLSQWGKAYYESL